MAKTDINENIYRAIDTIIDARLQNVNFNSTVLCTIVDDSKAASGIFTVDNLGVQFQATSMDKSFKVNDQVYVTVPNNNFDAQKIIIGKKEDFAKLQEQWKDPFSYLDIKYKFDDDSDEVTIVPTNDGQESDEIIKKIFLDDSYFNINWTNDSINEFTDRTIAQQLLLNSGWKAINENAPESVYKNNFPLRGIFRRAKGTQSSSYGTQYFYRIKDIDHLLVPLNTRDACDSYILKAYSPLNQTLYAYDYNTNNPIQWKENGGFNLRGWQDNIEIDTNMPNRRGQSASTDEAFPLFYNEKQYRPILLAGLKNIIITIDIQSDITFVDSSPSAGTYKLQCQLIMVHQNDSANEKTLTMTISSDTDFLGDPYNYFDYFTQQVVFDITNYQDYIVNKIEFSVIQNGNFTNIDSGIIKIKNPKIYFGLPLKETTIGYKSYTSMFEQSHEYYQKTSPTKLIYLQACLEDIPPTDPGLEVDGPFRMNITTYPKTTDTTINPDTTYYKIMYGSYEPVENPKETELSEYYEQVENSVLRYKPKIYIKNEDNEFVEDPDIKYFDQIYKTSNYNWDNNLYSWDAAKKQWYIKENDSSQNPSPRRDFYVCFPKNRKMSMYMGTVDSDNKEVPPQVGIASDDNNVDVVLAAGARDSNVLVSTADRNSKISIQAADRSSMELTNDAITLAVNGAALELTKAKLEALIALLDND